MRINVNINEHLKKPLMWAVAFTCAVLVWTLMPNAVVQSNESSKNILMKNLFRAIEKKNVDAIRRCLKNGAPVNGMIDGETALVYGLREDYYYDEKTEAIMRLLLEAGADPNLAGDIKRIAPYSFIPMRATRNFPLAFVYKAPKLAELLLNYGADPNALISNECSLLAQYIYEFTSLKYDEPNDKILKSIKLLLDHGADVEHKVDGFSPLKFALAGNNKDAADLLLAYGARPSQYAVHPKHHTFFYRLSGGVSVRLDTYDPQLINDYLLLVYHGYDDLVLESIKNGELDISIADAQGQDIFDYAARYGTANLMRKLLPIFANTEDSIFRIMTANPFLVQGLYFASIEHEKWESARVLYDTAKSAGKTSVTAVEHNGNKYRMDFVYLDTDDVKSGAKKIQEYGVYRYIEDGYGEDGSLKSHIDSNCLIHEDSDNLGQFGGSTVIDFFGSNRKLVHRAVLSGTAFSSGNKISAYGKKIYVSGKAMAFIFDTDTTKVTKSFYVDTGYQSVEVYVFIFPEGEDDIVYTHTVYDR